MPGEISRARLLEMMTAFKQTYLLRAAIELKIFDTLADEPTDPDTVAAILRTNPRATRILLRALAAAGLVEVDGEQFSLTPDARQLLVSTSPQYAGGVTRVAASDWEWEAMKPLAEVVRQGRPLGEVNAETPGFPYWVDFATFQTFATKPGAEFLADLVGPWADARGSLDVLDVGCGPGTFGLTLAARDTKTRVSFLDWPEVLDVTERHAARLDLAGRIVRVPGDAFTVDLGGPYDLAIVANVLFQFSAERATELLRRLHGALKPGGRIAVVGFTTGDAPPTQDYHAHMLELLMLAWTEGGEMHSTLAYRKMLATAGFVGSEVHSRPGLPLRVVLAERA